ncbi:IBR domain-containing protein [Balamuthia mandrillaris]
MNALRRFDEWKERLATEQKKVEEETERQAQRVSQAFQRVASAFANTASTTPEEELLKDNHVVALTDAIHNEKRFLNRQAAHPPLDDLYDGVQNLIELLQTMCRQCHEERAVISALLRQGEQVVDSPPNEKRLKELRRSSKKALQQIRYAQGDIEAAEDDEEKLEAERMLSKAKTKWKEQLIAMEREALQLVSMSNTHFPELRFKLKELGLGIVDIMAVDCPYRRLEHYDHVQVLSSAGRHCVMRAEFQGKPCVLKEFDLSFSADRQHFLRELKRLRALHHEHIVRVEGAFVHEEKGRTKGWIQMPFYTGGNLCEWLKSGRGGDRSEAEKQRAGRGVLLALQHIHSQGIIHRDVKPQNIFIEEAHRMVTDGEEEEDEQRSPYQQAILGDFDISSNATTAATIASTAMTTDGGAGGTWQYMAPELCSGDVGPEADMFAWGLVMFDLHFAAAALRAQAQGKDGDEEGRETQLPPGSRPTLMEMVKGKEIIIPSHPNHQLQDLLQQVLQLDPRKRPTASQCLSHPYLWSPLVEHRVAVRDRRQCLVCMQDKWLDEGLECYSPRQVHPHQRHFVCGGCMNDWVLSLLDMPPAELAERGRHVPCLVAGCASLPFSMEQVMAHLADVGRKALLEVCSKAIEFTNHQAFQQRLQEERQQWERESTVQRHCRRIVEDILTLQCPRCHQAFVDFDGCFALKCSRCNASFCGWCLQDCGKNAHPHVKMCASNNNRGGGGRGYHGSFAQFEEAQRRRREKRVREYLQLLGREEREQVMVTLKQELEDLKLQMI